MSASRRFALIGLAAAVAWYACVLGFWAFQPLSDSVPVGVDYSLSSPRSVSISLDCNGLFNSAPRGGTSLPALKVQPKGSPLLAFQREPCVVVQHQAREVFILDTALFAAVVVGFVWLALRGRRATSSALDPSLVGFQRSAELMGN